jgi:peptide deformylase
MILKLMQVGDPVLRQPAQSLSVDEIRSESIQRLIADMRDTMRDAPGVGLAAPQIGQSLQIAVIEDCEQHIKKLNADVVTERERCPVPFHVIINPELKLIGSDTADFFEGCLSLEGFSAMVRRHKRVRVTCLNQAGEQVVIEAKGWYARILQHEVDHLHGTVYIDRMESRTFMTTANYSRYWADQEISKVRKTLLRNPSSQQV